MNGRWEIIGEEGLRFFGEMSASISHEIKNVLAIIHESAGLLDDFTVMAEKGMPIDPVRLKNQAGKIQKQIKRADGIIKNMNRFAHSVDEPLRNADLNEILNLMCALSGRLAFMRGVALDLQSPQGPVPITTNPFHLENLVWLCLDFAMNSAGAGKTVRLAAEKRERGGQIRFSGLHGLAGAPTDTFPGEKGNALLTALNAELTLDVEAGELVLTLKDEAST